MELYENNFPSDYRHSDVCELVEDTKVVDSKKESYVDQGLIVWDVKDAESVNG